MRPKLITNQSAADGIARLTFGSLFSGIGGFDLGFERAGMQCKWQVEIDPYCQRVLAKHWPDVRRWGDVRTFPPVAWQECPCCDNFLCSWHGCHANDCPEEECPSVEDWEDRYGTTPYDSHHPGWNVDVICGGDPCQENSGARASGNVSQTSLGDHFIRVIAALRPRIVVRENPAHVRRDAPWPWWRFRSELESLGYAVLPFRLRACCFGADHQRERLFVLGELADANSKRLEGRKAKTKERHASESPGRIYAGDRLHLLAHRGLYSRAGVPGYVDSIRSLGNAVVPQVAQWIGRRIVEAYHAP
jgi:DNA (cytosine-5)-methyltransferase 1